MNTSKINISCKSFSFIFFAMTLLYTQESFAGKSKIEKVRSHIIDDKDHIKSYEKKLKKAEKRDDTEKMEACTKVLKYYEKKLKEDRNERDKIKKKGWFH